MADRAVGLNHHFAICKICGEPGHLKRSCPTKRLEEMKDRHGTQKRPAISSEPSDPADRDADKHTIFLPPRGRPDLP